MHSFIELTKLFEERFNVRHFPAEPKSLYDSSQYILNLGGKRIRPVLCLMGNELVNDINPDVYHVASAIELFHNFTLIHDDIMDKAPLRRGMQTVHTKYGEPSALLAGDVMLVTAYDYLNKIGETYKRKVINIFNRTGREVCEGQQIDMDFEKEDKVSFDDYVKMIELKTSVLLAASLQLGAILGGAGEGNQQHLYEFGKNLGIAFQVQDDYLDAFGDPDKFGKQVGGDILANKKTFLLIHALEVANGKQLEELVKGDKTNRVEKVLQIYKDCNVDKWAKELKKKYFDKAMHHLEEAAVLSSRKKPLKELTEYLMNREN
jgi:geranylgeranyl diphosphate synthase, type II